MKSNSSEYWHKNIKLIFLCLAVWLSVSFLAGIVFVKQLNGFSLGGYKLGFWFSQQGSIFSFVALIFFYNWRVSRLDTKYRDDARSELAHNKKKKI